MEGSGGIACPIRYDTEQQLMLTDIIQALHLPALVVADAGLGTINAVVTTCAYMQSLAIPIAGVLLNNFVAGDRLHDGQPANGGAFGQSAGGGCFAAKG